MEFTIQKDNLLTALEKSIRAIPSKSTQPMFFNFLIRIKGMDGEVIANNGLNMSIITKFTAMSVEDGEVLIDAKTLLQAVKKLGKGDITIKTDDEVAIVTSGKARFEFATFNASDFPQPYKVEDYTSFTINGTLLSSMIDGVAFAIGVNHNDKRAQGVGLKIKDNNLSLSTTNMIMVAVKNRGIEADDMDAIIPGTTITEIARMVGDEEVTIEISKVYAKFSTSEFEMSIRLTDGVFFDFAKVLDVPAKTSVKINRKDLLDVVDRALVVKTQDKQPIVLTFEPTKVKLEMKTSTKSFDEEIECEMESGLIKIGLDPAHLLEMLKAVPDDDIALGLDDSKAPLRIFADNGEYKYILLPISI